MDELKRIIDAAVFAAEKHKFQKRKGAQGIPYINHPLKVCKLISSFGENDVDLLVAALLHDVIEDTDTTQHEIETLFGAKVAKIVLEVTDDMNLPQKVRKEHQVIIAPKLSIEAKIIKVADKTANMMDIISLPLTWTRKRKLEYFLWSYRVFEGCRGMNEQIDAEFMKCYKEGIEMFGQ
jgi:guanosine-3',5'-bis(diphosphate) 3'-pyrophosphohydrolase